MSVTREMLAAGPGCAVANGLLNGFETTKVKLQLHDAARPVYHQPTTTGVIRQILAEEGLVRGLLTPGLSASLTRSMLYGSYRVGLYTTAREWMGGSDGYNSTTVAVAQRVCSGMATGGLGAMLSSPLDVIRTRLQADAGVIRNGMYQSGLRKGKAVRYRGMLSCAVRMWREEGLREGLYRGASVTVMRASLLNGSQLASYDTIKRIIPRDEGPLLHAVCALASGIIAQTFIMPVDAMKSQMMLGNGWPAVGRTIHQRGFFWLYSGYLPACAGQGLIMVLQMPLIEEFRRLLGVEAI